MKKGFKIVAAAVISLTAAFALSWVLTLGVPAKANGYERHVLGAEDFLHTEGVNIVNTKGEVIALRGTNAGGWLVYERWMNPFDTTGQQTIRRILAERFGAEVRDELIAVYEDAYWQEQDFDNCAEMGMSLIRLPFNIFNLCGDGDELLPNAFDRLDWFVENCRVRGIYVMLDLHGAFGSQNGEHHSGIINDGRQLYYNEENRAKTTALWQEIAKHYRGNPAVAGYDLLNEPDNDTHKTGEVQWDYFDELYDAVREVDPDHIIIMESCWTTADLPSPLRYGWKNVVYQYHHYIREIFDDETKMNWATMGMTYITRINDALRGVPSFVGEFSFFELKGSWETALKTWNRVGFGWTTWTYKVTGESSSWGIYNHTPETVYLQTDTAEEIRAKWSKVGYEYAHESEYYEIIKSFL
ncbi:MAG: glycoside hydrolase family 5 protein [Clostridiales bacterium]|jgi:aryl-phospho-beta-D-glucosidase BglC (GH1 family)|nr:glycoside hydrolase family 5 protein [Clostridiales bacterium]